MTPTTLDLDSLLGPIPGPDPAGVPISFVQRQQLDTARKSVNPADYPADDPLRPTDAKAADWPEIVQVTTGLLEATGKDLMAAARLTEALTKLYGFAGLRDGLTLLQKLIETAWDRITPPIEDGDMDVRAAPFNWLDDPDRGARFPSSVRAVPLLEDDRGSITWLDWKTAQSTPADEGGPSFAERFDKAVAAAPRAACQDAVDDLTAGLAAADQLVAALEEKLSDDAPSLSDLRKAMADCLELAKRILSKKPAPVEVPPPAAEEEEPAPAADEPAASGTAPASRANGVPAPARKPATRDDAYNQLAEAAALLQKLEPHSPIPFMIQRAVALGRLPFPELMKVMIRDPGVVTQLYRELGIEDGEDQRA